MSDLFSVFSDSEDGEIAAAAIIILASGQTEQKKSMDKRVA